MKERVRLRPKQICSPFTNSYNTRLRRAEKVWFKLLALLEERFYKPTVKAPKGRKHRKVYMGTCTLNYWDYRIQLKLLGIFERFIKQTVVKGNIAV